MRNKYIIKIMNCGIEEVEATNIYNKLSSIRFFDFDEDLDSVISIIARSRCKITSEELKQLNNKEI